MRSDPTSKAIWSSQWPPSLVFFVGIRLMKVGNLLTRNQFLQNNSEFLQKVSKFLIDHREIKFSISSVSAAGLLGPKLVSSGRTWKGGAIYAAFLCVNFEVGE